MKKINILFILVLCFLCASCCAVPQKPVPSAYDTASASFTENSNKYKRDSEYLRTASQGLAERSYVYDKTLTKFQIELNQEQLEAYGNWLRNRTAAAGTTFLQLLSPEQNKTILELEDEAKSIAAIHQLRKDLENQYEILMIEAKYLEKIGALESQRLMQESAAADNAFWHLHDQNMRTGGAMRQNAMDKLWPRR